jgi:hypothetical protein
MAKQKGIIKIKGTLGDMTFYRSQDGYIVKEKTSLNGNRISTDPAFQRTRENGTEFGRAGKAGKVLRNALRNQMQNAKDNRVVSRLTKEMVKVVKADATSTRGERNVIDGETEMLEGFEFNLNAKLEATLYAPYTLTINRVTGEMSVHIPSFIPANMVAAPDGTTHFKIVSAGTEVDFENETSVTDAHETAMLEWNNTATAVRSSKYGNCQQYASIILCSWDTIFPGSKRS